MDRILLLKCALTLLIISVVSALLWPTPCEADRKAALIRVGMTQNQVRELVGPDAVGWINREMPSCGWIYSDWSRLHIDCAVPEPHRLERIQVYPPDSPLDRLRRSLARVLPFLK
jgi:hypothetical protein